LLFLLNSHGSYFHLDIFGTFTGAAIDIFYITGCGFALVLTFIAIIGFTTTIPATKIKMD